MNITISDEAITWFQQELDLKKDGFVRFFAKYGGASPVQQGFSLGMSKEEPEGDIGAKTLINGITYYVLDKDLWYFDGHNLSVGYNANVDEPEYKYTK
ncbi:HesB/YadR/YfhF family protein [Mesobacillus maritimus]|uniref:HesB/YadR/YfhF family protein n=1 Tax=Mesobacillus maritimus TaxID=1643336 RepID=UPI00203E9C6F|nr:HesB/YadR/YfhF family protein [Mesobacillus maritimus]MCM3584435.1 HesB/YadR/YfhF family protein [Mesobacillus maritimus]